MQRAIRPLAIAASMGLVALALVLVTPRAEATYPGEVIDLFIVTQSEGADFGETARFDPQPGGSFAGGTAGCFDAGDEYAGQDPNSRIFAGELSDGTSGLLLTCDSPAGNGDIIFFPSDFGPPGGLITEDSDDYDPALSPEGFTVAYSSDREGRRNICLTEWDTQMTVCPEDTTDMDGSDWAPVWNPTDSNLLAFVSDRDGDPDIYVLDLESGVANAMTENDVNDFGPDFSPDGTHLLYSSQVDGQDQVFELDLETRTPVQLTSDDSHNFEPVYSPDGTFYAFTKQGVGPGSPLQVFAQSFSGGAAVPYEGQEGNGNHAEFMQAGSGGCEPNCEPPYFDREVTLKLAPKGDKLFAKGAVTALDGGSAGNAPECEVGIPVLVQKKTSSGWKKVGQDDTSSEGLYKAGIPKKKGKYRAKVKMQELTGQFPVTCGAATSTTKSFP